MKFFYYIYIFMSCISSYCLFTQKIFAEQRNTITFSSGYLESLYKNKQIANFGIEFFRNTDFLLGKLNTTINDEIDNKLLRLILFSATGLLNFQFTFAFLVSYHEFGHSTRNNALGFDSFFIKRRKSFEQTSNFFVYFLDGLFSTIDENMDSACTFVGENIKGEENAIISSGRLNNQIYFQEKAFDDLMYKYNKISYSYLIYSLMSDYNYYLNIKLGKKGKWWRYR